MKHIVLLYSPMLIICWYFLFSTGNHISGDNKKASLVKHFAVVELFTSEGCSSCPPADKAVAEVSAAHRGEVFVLGFHVDYWNRLGWKDVFSSTVYTERQRQYASFFNLQSIYTPQVIVNGKKEFVGSDKTLLDKTVENELEVASVCNISLSTEKIEQNKIPVTFLVDGEADILNVALVETETSIDVRSGENRGLTLNHINIVRDFIPVAIDTEKSGKVFLTIPKEIAKKSIKVIAYAQRNKTKAITGVMEIDF
jgi:hypothetical protein